MSARPWHKRYHGDAITGYMGLNLEERGAYTTILDHLYDRGEPLAGNIRMLAGFLDASVRKAQLVIESLISKGKLTRLPDGRITNKRFEFEREKDARTSDHMAMIGSTGGRKSAEKNKKPKKNNVAKQRPLGQRSSYPDTRDHIPDTTELLSERPSSLQPSQAPADAAFGQRKKSAVPDGFPHQAAKEGAAKFWRKKGRSDLVETVEDQAEQFRDHFTGHGKKMLDWPATWRTWVRNALQMTRPPRGWVPPTAAAPDDQKVWVNRMVLFHQGDEDNSVAKGYWRDEWGPAPGRPGCSVPAGALKAYAAEYRPRVAAG